MMLSLIAVDPACGYRLETTAKLIAFDSWSPTAPMRDQARRRRLLNHARTSAIKPVRRWSVLEECEDRDDPAVDWRSRDAQLGEDRVDVLFYGRIGKE